MTYLPVIYEDKPYYDVTIKIYNPLFGVALIKDAVQLYFD